jgi:hypothetical protein
VTNPNPITARRGACPEQLARARARKKKLALEAEARTKQDIIDRDAIIAGLIGDLGRVPTTNERLVFEDVAAQTVLARSLEARGRFEQAAEVRSSIARTRRATNFRSELSTPVENSGFIEFKS